MKDYALPLTLIRDAYEGVILAAFFYLLLNYLAPTLAEQKEYFRHYTLKRWCWPFGWVKSKPVSRAPSYRAPLTAYAGRPLLPANDEMGYSSILLD